MHMFSLRPALIAKAHATISSRSRISSQWEPSIFAYSNFTIEEIPEYSILNADNRILEKDEKQFSLEDDNFTEEEKMAKIQVQIQTMEKHCEYCKKPIITNFFPASITLECIMGVSDYPYKTEIVNFYDFHIKQCLSDKRCAYHRRCFSSRYLPRDKTCYFLANDSKKCFACKFVMPEEYILETAMQCLYKSSKPYEFAYIYKALKDYDGGDIRICLSQTDAPVLYAQKIKAKIEKCLFKGKNSMLASLDCFLLNESSEDKADVHGRFLRYALNDSILEEKTFWITFLNKCKDSDEVIQCLMAAVDNISEEHALMKPVMQADLLYACLCTFNKTQILQLITKCICSKQNYLLSQLTVISYDKLRHFFKSDEPLNTFPSALKILNILENNINSATDNTLLYSCIDKKARAVAAIISVLPFANSALKQVPIFIYLKRLYRLPDKKNKSFRSKKEYNLFCDSFLSQLHQNFLERKYAPPVKATVNNVMLLKICMFYNKIYGYKMQHSSFLAQIFSQMDSHFQNWPESSKKLQKIQNHLSAEERREILMLRAMNSNSKISLEEPMDLLNKDTQKSLAGSFVSRRRTLCQEGLQIIPQICKQFCTDKQYKRFLNDLCYLPEILQYDLKTNFMRDISEEYKNFPRSETGFLPLHKKFYDLLGCDEWEDKDVMEWCEKNNVVDWLRSLPTPRLKKYKLYDFNHKYKFIKRHFKMIIKYVLERSENNFYLEAEVVAKCWFTTLEDRDFFFESNMDIFNALACAKNRYFHANIFYLLKSEEVKTEIACSIMDKICSHYNNGPVAEQEVIELQKIFVRFVKKWEETDITLSNVSMDMGVIIRSLVGKLEEIKELEVDTHFNDFAKHANALKSIRENKEDFYRVMAESLGFIPQAALDFYGQ
ncbi:hypothetical protein ENBRE01_2406 [Enteropsectra breve]|nr:hypothetical protein ENBRE01_2406 [Enteropsectra breve]